MEDSPSKERVLKCMVTVSILGINGQEMEEGAMGFEGKPASFSFP